jgi:hypothetical protein
MRGPIRFLALVAGIALIAASGGGVHAGSDNYDQAADKPGPTPRRACAPTPPPPLTRPDRGHGRRAVDADSRGPAAGSDRVRESPSRLAMCRETRPAEGSRQRSLARVSAVDAPGPRRTSGAGAPSRGWTRAPARGRPQAARLSTRPDSRPPTPQHRQTRRCGHPSPTPHPSDPRPQDATHRRHRRRPPRPRPTPLYRYTRDGSASSP